MKKGCGIKTTKHSFYLTLRRGNGMGSAVVNNGLRAFTLIELLIVVAIIAILAAIAVPNFLEAQTRAKVARVTADMRTMLTAVEMYRVDSNKPPIRHDDWQSDDPNPPLPYPKGDTKLFDPAVPEARVGMKVITTPISYMSSIPLDVFNTPVKGIMHTVPGTSDALDYWDPIQVWALRKTGKTPAQVAGISKQGFCFLSVGPDQHVGINAQNATYPQQPLSLRNTVKQFYDPTNGTSSAGNVYRFSDNLEQKDL
jgi:prepilin-type N-terminal cleavage/methylation domain-containing protein